jgi:quinol monooxygenase YgiN
MSEPILYVDTSAVRQGELERVKAAAQELVEFVEANEPQLISYGFFFNEEGTRMTVVAVHPDSASMEFHMKIGGPLFRKFSDWIDLEAIDVYGRPSETVLNQLFQKARMLGRGTVRVHTRHAGFERGGSI